VSEPPAGPRPPVTITVRGLPTPQGSKSGFAAKKDGEYTGRVRMVEGSNKSAQARQRMRDWRQDVRTACERAMDDPRGGPWPMLGPLTVSVIFTVPKPATAPKTKRTWPCKRPDLDKYLRSVFDSITSSGLWKDDAQAVRLQAAKCYPGDEEFALAVPGAVITIAPVT
jgi:crossover junction endodeoxyribonuclease RusA